MIKLTRISNACMILNSDLIEHIDQTPDTVITLISGQKLMVRETVDEVVEKVIAFRRTVLPYAPVAAVNFKNFADAKAEEEAQEFSRNG